MSAQPTQPAPKLPLATWLVPVLALVFLGGLLMLGKTPVTPAKPPHLRTPDGKEVVPTPTPGDPATPGDPEVPATPQPAPVPDAPIFPGATLITDTPYWRYQIKGGNEFEKVRDYYIGHFGDKIQYAESVIPATGLKRAICFTSDEPEAVQISETSEAGVLELAIGPIAMLRGVVESAPAAAPESGVPLKQ